MKHKIYLAVLLFVVSWFIDNTLVSVLMALGSAALFFESAIKDLKKARRLHNELKADKD